MRRQTHPTRWRMGIETLIQKDWVLLPGTLCSADVFTGFLDALDIPGTRRRGVTLGRPHVENYGDLVEVSRNAVVCGFSLGAIVAAHHAAALEASALVLFGLNPYSDDPAKAEGRHALASDVAQNGASTALEARLPPFNGPDPAGARQKVLKMADLTAALIEPQTRLALSRPGALQALSNCRCPVLVLTGENDVMAPPDQGRAAAEAAPGGQFHLLTGLGHYALIEDPAACAAALTDMEDRP